ncbi:MAG: methionine adenosyltransferase [Rhodobacteraceae bacterium]|nr:methionine adenosyltransferase [Paracoccaceae bacterium]
MSSREYLFTSESVSRGHPDKVCDQISDAVLDAFLEGSSSARVACETLATTNRVIVAGEFRGAESVRASIESIVRNCVRGIGYEQEGFHWEKLAVSNFMHAQSENIAAGVDAAKGQSEGAGDQGLMFGYAVDETREFMPAPILLAHRMLQKLDDLRNSKRVEWLGPDAKSQLTYLYRGRKPVRITNIVLSTQHLDESLTSADIERSLRPILEEEVLEPADWRPNGINWLVNPTGKFVIGGPDGDCGLTGRKIIVDTYGGAAPHGGGAFSGKDPTKVDRSAAYAARYLAKNVVAAGLAARCCIQVSYAIGKSEPTSFYVNTYGTETVAVERIERRLRRLMDLTPRGIKQHLGLHRPIFERTAAYGHFGREPQEDGGFSWERTDLIDELAELK